MNTRRVLINSVLGLGIVGAGVASWVVVAHKKTAVTQTSTVVTASKANVLSSVTGTGNVLVPSQIDVSFDSAVASNKVLEVLVNVGDKVTVGQALAGVDDTAVQQTLVTAQAQLAQAQAAYDKAANPFTPDVKAANDATLAQANVALANARASVTNAQTALEGEAEQQDIAVQQATDAVTSAQAKADLDLANQQAQIDAAQATLDADTAKLTAAQAALAAATPNTPAATQAQTALDGATATVAKDTTALSSARNQLASLQLSTAQSVTNAQNALGNAQRSRDSKVAADQNAIDQAKRQLTAAQASYSSTVASLAVKEKAPTDSDLASQKVALLNAQNSVTTAQKNIDNTILKAPIAGTVVTLNGKVGFAASSSGTSSAGSGSSGAGGTGSSSSSSSSSSGFLTLTDLSAMQVKVGFSESDATSVTAGLGATVTFDSLPNVALTGKVAQSDLTATTVSNVVTYYSYITLDAAAGLTSVKPGMTASVQLVVNHADGVVTLPASAVTARGTTATVNVMKGTDTKVTTPTPITIGLKGDNTIEVKSGLAAGDKVVVVRQSTTGVGTTGTRTRTGTGTGTLGGGTGVVPGGAGGGPRGG